jgi:hypothetical protein
LIKGIKARGIYDSTISEFSKLFSSEENDLVAAESAAALMEKGGLEKAIWMLPIEKHAQVLVQLYTYRESLKQSIYEITGLSDIMRGSTNASETLGAQQLKSQWGSMRLQRRQRDVQRFVRDLLRIKAEIISEKFSPETIMMITGIKLPTQAEKQQAQMMAQIASAQGQPVPPELQAILMKPSIDDVLQVIRSDSSRSMRIDIETDSTIATQLDADRKDMTELMTGLGGFIQNIGPAVQTGFIPGEVAKNLLMSLTRKFKLGNDVEDAVDSMQAQAAGGGEAQQAQMEQARKQIEEQGKQVQQGMQQLQQQAEQQKQEAMQLEEGKRQLAYDNEVLRLQKDAAIREIQIQYREKEAERIINENNAEATISKRISDLENATKDLLTQKRETDASQQAVGEQMATSSQVQAQY